MLKTPVTAAVLLAAVASRQPLTAPSTELVIHAVDEDGAPVALTRADVYLDLWNGGDLVPLPRPARTISSARGTVSGLKAHA